MMCFPKFPPKMAVPKMPRAIRALRRFRHDTAGSGTVEFAIIVPLMLLILASSVELGLITVRQTMLDRAVDLTVRDIRLGTGANWQHSEIRDKICERTPLISNCAIELKLEMAQLDPYAPISIDDTPDCITSVEEVDPVVSWVNGESNELMFLRACLTFDPVFPHVGLGADMNQDGDGRVNLFASSIFVQEPQ